MAESSAFVLGLPKARVFTSGGVPRLVAELAEVSIDFATEVKALESVKRIAVGHVVTGQKITGKAKQLAVQPWVEAQKIGATHATGRLVTVDDEAGSVPGSSTYTISVTHSANWTRDLGVTLTADGTALTPVTGTPSAGEYSVAAGVYTFNVAQASAAVKISYVWSDSTTGEKVTLSNANQGEATAYILIGDTTLESKTLHLELLSVVFTKGGLAMSKDNQTSPEVEFVVQAPTGVSPVVFSVG